MKKKRKKKIWKLERFSFSVELWQNLYTGREKQDMIIYKYLQNVHICDSEKKKHLCIKREFWLNFSSYGMFSSWWQSSLFVFAIETVLEQLRICPPVLHIMYNPGIMVLRQNKNFRGKASILILTHLSFHDFLCKLKNLRLFGFVVIFGAYKWTLLCSGMLHIVKSFLFHTHSRRTHYYNNPLGPPNR